MARYAIHGYCKLYVYFALHLNDMTKPDSLLEPGFVFPGIGEDSTLPKQRASPT